MSTENVYDLLRSSVPPPADWRTDHVEYTEGEIELHDVCAIESAMILLLWEVASQHDLQGLSTVAANTARDLG